MRVAVIDLGSNSVRMTIAQADSDKISVLKRCREAVRLSEGMGPEKTIKPLPAQRTLAALEVFCALLKEYEVQRVRAVATAALRTAVNPEVILMPALQIGLDIEIIDGEREAYYDFLAASRSLPMRDFVMLDTGGASHELALVRDGECLALACIPYGAVNITEQFLAGERISQNQLQAAEDALRARLQSFDWLQSAQGLPVAALGGTLRILAKIIQVRRGETLPLHGYPVSRQALGSLLMELSALTVPQRRALPGMDTARADIFVGGMLPCVLLMQAIESPRMILCNQGVREGVLYDLTK